MSEDNEATEETHPPKEEEEQEVKDVAAEAAAAAAAATVAEDNGMSKLMFRSCNAMPCFSVFSHHFNLSRCFHRRDQCYDCGGGRCGCSGSSYYGR